VAHDSADVWSRPELFWLDEEGEVKLAAGVPPDYFSKTGQLWGNPLYRWDLMAKDGYQWWIDRLRMTFQLVDIVRLDHFRGFEAYWAVPGGEETAVNGQWKEGPGAAFFEAIREQLGDVPIVVEDLGAITEAVEQLRDQFGFPGIRVLQFVFDPSPEAEALRPHSFVPNSVVYTGTHDNDTTVGWFENAEAEGREKEREFVLKYIGRDGREINWELIRLAMASVANTAIIPLQDVLGYGSEARMNVPAGRKGIGRGGMQRKL
jgi:4-alpha-glucanotransferase